MCFKNTTPPTEITSFMINFQIILLYYIYLLWQLRTVWNTKKLKKKHIFYSFLCFDFAVFVLFVRYLFSRQVLITYFSLVLNVSCRGYRNVYELIRVVIPPTMRLAWSRPNLNYSYSTLLSSRSTSLVLKRSDYLRNLPFSPDITFLSLVWTFSNVVYLGHFDCIVLKLVVFWDQEISFVV